MSDAEDFEYQLKQEQLINTKESEETTRTKVDDDGTEFEWDEEKKAWFPKIDANFIAQYQMNYGKHEINDEEASKAVKQAAYMSEVMKQGTDSEAVGEGSKSTEHSEVYNWKYYYDLACKYAPQEGQEQSEEDKKYYDYYNYYYQYYYSLEQHQGYEASDNDKSDQITNTNSDAQLSKDEIGIDKKKSTKTDSVNYDADEYWDQYTSEHFIPKEHKPDQVQKKDKAKKRKEHDANILPAKRSAPEAGWFEIEEKKNTNVYVSGLPPDITNEEYIELMNKCGLIVYDPKSKGLKAKLYRDSDNKPKGDGVCCYIKPESVELALNLLDESYVRGYKISVEKARFEMKGNFDPNKRKYKKLSNKEKRKAKENQAKLLDWRPDKQILTKSKSDRIVVMKNLFDPKDFDTQPERINTVRQAVRQQCSQYGEINKTDIHDNHPDGVATIVFKEFDGADLCVKGANGGIVLGRVVTAEIWDGKTKYTINETDEQREKRLKNWDKYLEEGGEEKGEVSKNSESEGKEKNMLDENEIAKQPEPIELKTDMEVDSAVALNSQSDNKDKIIDTNTDDNKN